MQLEVETDYTDYWQQHVKKAIENVITKEFDIKLETTIESFKS